MTNNGRGGPGSPRTSGDHGTTSKPITIIYFKRLPYIVDIPACRKALVRRQVEGELTNMTSLAVAAAISRSTASRFFSGRSVSLAALLRILKVLRLEFHDVCQEATDEEVAEWERQEAERKRQDAESQQERQRRKLVRMEMKPTGARHPDLSVHPSA